MRLRAAAAALTFLVLAGCSHSGESESPSNEAAASQGWVYQLSGYADGGLAEIAAADQGIAVIDLARDGGSAYFTAEEIGTLHEAGKTVYAYFTIGTIETYRPEYEAVADTDMVLNRWGDWPDEHFVAYWDARWWDRVVEPRLDQALEAGFDGVYLDVPNAYEEIDLDLVPGEDRESLAVKMVELIAAAKDHVEAERPDFEVLPQNAPELRRYPGYMDAIDGIGVEDLFFRAHDDPCDEDWCEENLEHVRAMAEAGKRILAVDYAADPGNIAEACGRYAEEGFTGYVTEVDLDAVGPPCP